MTCPSLKNSSCEMFEFSFLFHCDVGVRSQVGRDGKRSSLELTGVDLLAPFLAFFLKTFMPVTRYQIGPSEHLSRVFPK